MHTQTHHIQHIYRTRMNRGFFLHTKKKVSSKKGKEGGRSKSKLKNDEHRKREVCPLTCLIKINDWTHYHSRNTLQKESDRGKVERTAKGEGDKRGELRRVTERK